MTSSTLKNFRRDRLVKPVFKRIKKILPNISETEQQALDAGDVWWDAEILSGKPDWQKLQQLGKPALSPDEQKFLDGPVEKLCAMIDDWEINFVLRRLPVEIWDYLKQERFFGMIIPRKYGGLGFSAYAHSEIVTRISACSTSVAVTVMVPNSLGPGELLLLYGTQAQKDYYLPLLASGDEIPCFALTSPEAGSDAAAMTDSGVVCYQQRNGEKQLGIRANWHKRYITLGPVATLMGLAIKVYDPDHILGEKTELGITVALVATDAEGVEIGRRHYPSFQAFQNGPNQGHDVFISMDSLIGGQQQIGRGWVMLMTALAAGRSISLPSLSAGGAKLAAHTTGAYARVREQFGIPIGNFEGVQARLANIATQAYLLDAARVTTTMAVDSGKHPAVISAILKSQSTNRLRDVINDAMDVHGGKTVCDGPANYLGNLYRALPVAITVEGANLLTRNLIIFGQGAIRCHPWLLEEIEAARDENFDRGLEKFDRVLFRHAGFILANLGRSWWHNVTGGRFAAAAKSAGIAAPFYRSLSRYSASLTSVAEMALLTLGGELKRKELLSARLGDVLSEIYLLSCVLHRFSVDDQPKEDLPLIQYLMESGQYKMQQALSEVLENFPNRPLAFLMSEILFPWGKRQRTPGDVLAKECANLLMSTSASRKRITRATVTENSSLAVKNLEQAFTLVQLADPIEQRIKESRFDTPAEALDNEVINKGEFDLLSEKRQAVEKAISVDDYSAEELSPAFGDINKTRKQLSKQNKDTMAEMSSW